MFKGTGVALVTPFDKGRLDLDALARVTQHVIDGGVEFLVPLGSTGEAITLSAEEKREVLKVVRDVNEGRLPIVAGFGGSDTRDMVRQLDRMNLDGIDGLLMSSPAYNKPSQEGIVSHYATLAHISPLPIILYNVPGRTGSNVLPQTIVRLASEHDNIVAVKEASGSLQQCMDILNDCPDTFTVLSGEDPLTVSMLSMGGHGVISVISNAFPKTFSEMVRAGLNGNFDAARKLHYTLHSIHPLLYVDGNPAGIKTVMELLGICSHEVRMPLAPMRVSNKSKLEEMLATLVPMPA